MIAGPPRSSAVSGPSRTLGAVDAAGEGVREPPKFRAEHANFHDLRRMPAHFGCEVGERRRHRALCHVERVQRRHREERE